MIRTAFAAAAAAGMLIAGAGAASADDRGNHGAIWKADQHMALESGSEWGALIGGMASNGELKPYGVSEGVHSAKGNGPK